METVLEISEAIDFGELREQAGLTVRDLAELTGLNPWTIDKAELGGAVNESTRRLLLVALREPDALRKAVA